MQHQDTEISFSFTVEEVGVIRDALGQMPHDEVRPIVEKIYSTIHDHVFGKEEDFSDEDEQHEFKLYEYPFGVKKDGTPKKRPGRARKEK
jgi:hypothetical protein